MYQSLELTYLLLLVCGNIHWGETKTNKDKQKLFSMKLHAKQIWVVWPITKPLLMHDIVFLLFFFVQVLAICSFIIYLSFKIDIIFVMV